MNKEKLDEILRSYASSSEVPEQVRTSFGEWYVDSHNSQQSDDSLGEIWKMISEKEVGQTTSRKPPVSMGMSRVKRLSMWFSYAAALFFAVVSIGLWSLTRRPETCLASSEWGKASFVLPDGSKVWLNRGSKLYYRGDMEDKRIVRVEGEAYFSVRSDVEHPFFVKVSDLEIKVTGTKFTVSAYDENNITTYLEEGRVELDGPGLKEAQKLLPNQSIYFDRQAMRYVVRNMLAANHTSWIKERLVFDDASLFDIVENLSHWYGSSITCPDEKFAKETKLTLTVRQEPLHEILSAIESLAPVISEGTGTGDFILTNTN